MEPTQLIIGGKTVKTARHHEIHNPSTGEVVRLMPLADEADLDKAVGAASAAFTTWKDITDSERADACRRMAAKANDSPTGLGGSVWGTDLAQAKDVARQLECGSVWINSHGTIQPNAPFGGVKQSGFGVEFGAEGLKEFTTIQTMFC